MYLFLRTEKKNLWFIAKNKKIIYLFHHNINIYLHVKSKYPRQRRILLHLRVPIEKKTIQHFNSTFLCTFRPSCWLESSKTRPRCAPLGQKIEAGRRGSCQKLVRWIWVAGLSDSTTIIFFTVSFELKRMDIFSHCGQFTVVAFFVGNCFVWCNKCTYWLFRKRCWPRPWERIIEELNKILGFQDLHFDGTKMAVFRSETFFWMPASIPMNFNFVQRLLPQRVVLVNSDEQQEVKAPEKMARWKARRIPITENNFFKNHLCYSFQN